MSRPDLSALHQEASMTALVDDLNHCFVDLWWQCGTDVPPLEPIYTSREQRDRETHLVTLLDSLTAEVKHLPLTALDRGQVGERVTLSLREFARSALGFEDRHLQAVQSWRLIEAAGEFVQMARAFDPTISAEDIYQASRNVMSMNFMQLLLSLPVEVTPAVFAYSLLYPYTDNMLDNAALSREAKCNFNERFARRLAGESITPATAHEQTIYELVGMIEDQFDRSHYPQVFESLLAIQAAQTRSLRLHDKNASPYELDVLGLSFEKGGTSVLADGYLVAGSISRLQAEFMYGYGAFTQLMDDLEDVEQDRRAGIMTIFSQTAQAWPLDRLTNRLIHFGHQVFSSESLACFDGQGAGALKEFMGICLDPLLVDSIGRASPFYSSGYLHKMEAHLPFRFAVLDKQRRKFARHVPSLMRLAEMLAAPQTVPAYQTDQTSVKGVSVASPVLLHSVEKPGPC